MSNGLEDTTGFMEHDCPSNLLGHKSRQVLTQVEDNRRSRGHAIHGGGMPVQDNDDVDFD